MEDMQATAQMAMDLAISRKALEFDASMNAALITGSFEKAAELQASMNRNAGLAAQGIGVNLNLTI